MAQVLSLRNTLLSSLQDKHFVDVSWQVAQSAPQEGQVFPLELAVSSKK